MRIEDILRGKPRRFITASPEVTLADAAEALRRHDVGALLVVRDRCPDGLVTERDVVYAVAQQGPDALGLSVSDVMTCEPPTCRPSDHIDDAVDIMARHRTAHVLVMAQGSLVGVVSMGDVLRHDYLRSICDPPREFGGRIVGH